ncbi:MAG: hypothetical protein K1W41_23490 [Lachnospiraceae bacterium]
MDKREVRKLSQMFNPQTRPAHIPTSRPAHIPTSRRVKWRLVKKWFNRYEKQTLIGRTAIAVSKTGAQIPMRITAVKIEKAGGHRRNISIEAKPIKI